MKLFSSYIKKSKNGTLEDVILLNDLGVSLAAFFFGVFWFLYKKMWKESAVLVLVNYLFFSFYQRGLLFDQYCFLILEIGFAFLVACNAEYWYGEYLKKSNYKFAGLYFGKSEMEAKLRFLDSYFSKSSPNLV